MIYTEVAVVEDLLSLSWDDVGPVRIATDESGQTTYKFYSPSMVLLGTLVRDSESDDLALPD